MSGSGKTILIGSATVRLYIDWFGDENVVFPTDYPHADSKFPRAT